jgi:hypothetical protein
MSNEFNFTRQIKRKVVTFIAIGFILALIGIVGLKLDWWSSHHGEDHVVSSHSVDLHQAVSGNHVDHHGSSQPISSNEANHNSVDSEHSSQEVDHKAAAHGGGHHESHWYKRVIAALWHNAVFFTGVSLLGVFFLALQYVTWSGWSASIKRVMEAMGYGLFLGAPLIIVVLAFGAHDLFHWTHEGLMTVGSENYDAIIAGKEWYLNTSFYWSRTIIYLAGWVILFLAIRKESLLEDKSGNIIHHRRQINWSAGFLVFFGVSSSMMSWDWIMSIDPHWFSTLFGWYVLASLLVTAVAVMILLTLYLKGENLLEMVNQNHIHDLGKFLFGFSIFWMYLWFSQFILLWYSNVPEEVIYYLERMDYNEKVYSFLFALILVVNFLLPLLWLMTRDAKRNYAWLKVAAMAVIIGHWLDFYMMIYPGVMKNEGGIDLGFFFLEVGFGLFFAGAFIYMYLTGLSKAPVVAANHPFLEESKHLHV